MNNKYSYYKCKKLGEGTYAIIYLAKTVQNTDSNIDASNNGNSNENNNVSISNNMSISNNFKKLIKLNPQTFLKYSAIKKIKKTEYACGQEISAIREIKMLSNLKSPYVVGMEDIFIHKGAIHIVLEYVEYDLEMILKNKMLVIMPGDIKAWMHMLLAGLMEIHKLFYIHRDIKPNNLLIKKDGTLKIADFGLTRRLSNKMTVQAITRWYRAPEVLLGSGDYSLSADMWAVGCVFAELFLRVPLFASETDIGQLNLIFQALGVPSESEWPLMKNLPGYFEVKKIPTQPIDSLFTAATADAKDLLHKLLIYDPNKRITCLQALNHNYFISSPPATSIGSLPVPE